MFPRKLLTGQGPDERLYQAKLDQWHVDPFCCLLWQANRIRKRNDTFIGFMDTESCTLYIAPCFGVTAEECAAKLGGAAAGSDGRLRDLRERLAKYESLPNDLQLASGSTSVEADNARTCTLGVILPIYGDRGACLAPWTRASNKADGNSHSAMIQWIIHNPHIQAKPSGPWVTTALGFAIQRDKDGYYVRFASGYNQHMNQAINQANEKTYTVFAPRSDKGNKRGYNQDREPRDLPKEWAMKMVEVIARDLHVGYFKPGPMDWSEPFFERMVSRGEGQTTKFKRLQARLT